MIELRVGGKRYSGWKQASVRRSINAFTSSADFVVSDYTFPRSIPLDAPCQVLINNIPVITGYVDVITPSYNATSHEVAISARSKTCDLVDCSAMLDTGQIMQGDVKNIINKIIEPFGIGLKFKASGAFPVIDFQLQQGETASTTIEKLCVEYGLVFMDDAEGNLVITKISTGSSVGSLIHKVGAGSHRNNILSGSCEYSRRDRFSEYRVLSQMSGNDYMTGEQLTSVNGVAIDNEISRYRPMVLLAESSMDNAAALARAEWELSTRVGKSIAINYTLQGWLNNNGDLWAPNSFVTVDDDEVSVKSKLIISEVSLSINDSGTTTTLQLSPPEAFIPDLAKEKNTTAGAKLKDGEKQ